MTFGEQNPSSLDDDQFERMLFDSARQDEPSADVEAFWARLNTTIDGVARLSAASAGAGSSWALGGRLYRAIATKWLILGIVAGSALTALSFSAARAWRGAGASQPVLVPPIISTPESRAELIQEPASRLEDPSSQSATPAPVPRRSASGRVALPRASSPRGATPAQPDSTLAAQVALLDAAQTAVAAGMLGEALRLADRYRSDYPNGELSPEAEVVAIEALAARGDQAELAARAARFLARYPSDPHAARVKWLAR